MTTTLWSLKSKIKLRWGILYLKITFKSQLLLGEINHHQYRCVMCNDFYIMQALIDGGKGGMVVGPIDFGDPSLSPKYIILHFQ